MLLGSGRVKVVLRTLMKLSPDRLSYAIGIWARKNCAYNIDEIEPRWEVEKERGRDVRG